MKYSFLSVNEHLTRGRENLLDLLIFYFKRSFVPFFIRCYYVWRI